MTGIGEEYHNLADWQIDELINGEDPAITSSNKIKPSQIQPSSLDLTIGDEAFALDPSIAGIVAEKNKTVYDMLKDAGSKAKRMKLDGQHELKINRTYAIRANEKIMMGHPAFRRVKGSQKSSYGRIFYDNRLIGDCNPAADELNLEYLCNKPLEMWLIIDPLAFDTILHPGTAITQVRFFAGKNYMMGDEEIMHEVDKNPILYTSDGTEHVKADHVIANGLQIHLNLSGNQRDGVVALRVRNVHDPIDTSKIGHYDIDDYFERLTGNKIKVRPGEHYLLSSAELLRMWPNLASELNMTSHIGPRGMLHYAGFIDNGFFADLVFEYSPSKGLVLEDGMPMGRISLFRTLRPRQLYGGERKSNYQGQIGVKPAKFYKDDFSFAA